MPHQLVLDYLFTKTNFVFNQTLYTPLTERYAEMTPSNFFERTLLKELSLTKAKFYLVNSSNPAKTGQNSRAYYARTRDKSGSNSPPVQRNVQILPSPSKMHSQMPRPDSKQNTHGSTAHVCENACYAGYVGDGRHITSARHVFMW